MPMSVVYATVNGRLVEENRGGVVTRYLPDTLGNVIKTADVNGKITSETTYWPFGEVRTQTGKNPSPWGFCGVWGYLQDTAARLYVRARCLRADLGRWMTVDPLWPGEPAYGYGSSRPLDSIDYSGKKVYLCKGSIVGPDINHWFLIIDGPHCPRIRIDFSYEGVLIGQKRPGVSGTENHHRDTRDRCFEMPFSAGIESCLCKAANEFRSDPNDDRHGGSYWRPSTGHVIPGTGGARPLGRTPGEYHFFYHNCQHFVITMIRRCGGPLIPDELSRHLGGNPKWKP